MSRDIVAVIGTTGVGKSNLAVSLARSVIAQPGHGLPAAAWNSTRSPLHYNDALVLSADSMQLYTGLDVITNKMTKEEMGGVKHWGLDVVRPGEPSWELGRWCNEADAQLKTLPPFTLPIICGGTHYFIQHFLFPPPEMSLDRSSLPDKKQGDNFNSAENARARAWVPPCPCPPSPTLSEHPSYRLLLETFWTPHPIWPSDGADQDAAGPSKPASPSSQSKANNASNWSDRQLLDLHHLLCLLEPAEAQRWHWRDGRKVKRSIERWWEAQSQPRTRHESQADSISPSTAQSTGKEQHRDEVGRRARFRTLIFWVYDDMEVLRPRLDRRVDRMVDHGLWREIAELRDVAAKLYGSADLADHTEGIFQSIGYKEFASLSLNQPSPTSDAAFPGMLDRMKISTHQYAKSQIKWIKKQLLPAIKEARSRGSDVEVYVVPGGPKGEEAAQEALGAFLERRPMPPIDEIGHPAARDLLGILRDQVADTAVPDIAKRQILNAQRICPECSKPDQPCSIVIRDWDLHQKSKAHRRNARLAQEDKATMIARLKEEGQRRKAQAQAHAQSQSHSEAQIQGPALQPFQAQDAG